MIRTWEHLAMFAAHAKRTAERHLREDPKAVSAWGEVMFDSDALTTTSLRYDTWDDSYVIVVRDRP